MNRAKYMRWHTVHYNVTVHSLATAVLLVQPAIFGPDNVTRIYGTALAVFGLIGGINLVLYMLMADESMQPPWLEVWVMMLLLPVAVISFQHIPSNTAHTVAFYLITSSVLLTVIKLCLPSVHISSRIKRSTR